MRVVRGVRAGRDVVRRVPVEVRLLALGLTVVACLVVGLLARQTGSDAAAAVPPATYRSTTVPEVTPSDDPTAAGVPLAVGGAVPVAPSLAPRVDGELPAAAAPMRIRVPRLGVDSAVVPISGATGVLEPPSDARELGWWQEGAVPGSALGTTVMTGHTLHLGGGALDKLKTLRPGDRITVTTTRGTVRYEVRASWALSKPDLAQRAESLFDQGREGRLVLVTCYDWTGSEYLSNAVVSAAPIGSDPA